MRRLLSFILFLCFTIGVMAQSDYGLTVAGTPVTSANKSDILGDGKVSYDPASHTLRLKNANIETGTSAVFTEDRLIIDLEGTNSFIAPRGVESIYNPTSASDYAITICSSSGGSLSTEGYESAFSVANSGGIYVRDCSITTKQSMSAFYGYISGNNTTLKIEHANIDIQGQSTEACIAGFESLVLEKCDIVEPSNAYYKSAWGYGAMRQGDDDTKCINLKIKAKEATEYGISVSTLGDEVVSVNSENYTNVLGDGTLSYNPETNVLKMNDVHLFGFAVLDICKKDLRIEVSGTQNSIEGFCMINTSCTLVGSNTKKSVTSQLNVNSLAWSSSLTIQDLAVEFIGGKQGLQTQSGSASLTLKNAIVNANGAAGVFKSIPSLVLEDCEILTPEGAYYDPAKKYIVDESGNRVTGVVTIGPKVEPVVEYYIEIGDVMITSENCADVLGDGTLSYDPVANVLLLNNLQAAEKSLYIGSFSISVESMKAKNKDLAGIKVKVTGNNALETLNFHGGVDGTLCGDGTLVLESETAAQSTLHSWDNLLIEDCNLVLKAPDGYGITMWNDMGAPGKLTIRNASVKINAGGYCIGYFSSLVLEGCSILKPFGAYYDPAKQEVVDKDGNPVKGELIIAPGEPVVEYYIEIGDVMITSENCADVLGDGTLSYDPATNVLSLNNLQAPNKYLSIGELSEDMSFKTMAAMNKDLAGIKVKVTGDNALRSINFYGGVNGTLCGDGTLVLESETAANCTLNSWDNLLIEDCNLVLKAPDGYGITMWNDMGAPGKLTIRNASVKINAGGYCIGYFSDLVLEGCVIHKPYGAYFDPAKQEVVDKDGNPVTGNLLIGPENMVVEYGIRINSSPYDKLEITSENCADVLGDGTLSYDPATNVLSLNNLQAPDKYIEVGELDYDMSIQTMEAMNKDLAGIKVKVIGDNALESLLFYGGVNGTLCGDGNLLLQENMDGPTPALHSWDNLLIEDCNLVARGGIGIEMWGLYGAPGKLTIRNATIKIESNPQGQCIEYLSDLVLEGCVIHKPYGAYFDPAKQEVVDKDGNPVTGELIIAKDEPVEPVFGYDLMFYDEVTYVTTWLNSKNSTDVFDDGTVSYDFYANVLTLNNAVKNNLRILPNVQGIMPELFTMKLVGDNSFKLFGVQRKLNCNICGDGKLSLSGNCVVMGGDLLIEDCQLDIDGGRIILPEDGVLGKLTIRNATVRINSENSCIDEISDLVLEGCTILKPFGAYFDPAQHAVVDKDGNPVKGELVIAKTATPDKGTGTQDDPFELGGTLDKILGGGGTGGTGTGGTGGGSTGGGGTGGGGTGTGTGIDGTGSGSYPNPPVIITPPAGTGSHYSYTAKDDCVLGLVVNVGNEFEGRLTINGADAGKIEDREMILHKGDVVMLNIANAGKDDMVGINIRKLCEGDLWNMAIELHEGKNDILKVVENKNLPRWYRVTVPAKTPMAINIDAKGKAYVFTDENVEKETLDACFRTTSEGDGIAYDYNNASSTPLTLYVKLIAAEKDCIATVTFNPTAIDSLSTEQDNAPAYNLQGLRVGNDYKGIVIINGKKVLVR